MREKPLSETSAILAAAHSLNEGQRASLHRRVRLFDAKGLLPTRHDESGTGQLDPAGCAMAAVFCAMVDAGFDAEMLRPVRDAMQMPHGLQGNETRWERAVEAVKNGQNVTLTIRTKRNAEGRVWPAIRFEGSDSPRSGRVETALRLHDLAEGTRTAGEFQLDIGGTIAPIVRAFAE